MRSQGRPGGGSAQLADFFGRKPPPLPSPACGEGVREGYFAAAFWVARVAALATALKEAVTMSLSMPTP
jgi:hypothetical protein